MSREPGTLELVGQHLTLAMQPLKTAVSDPNQFRALMVRLGWDAAGLPPAYVALGTAIDGAVAKLEALTDTATPEEIKDFILAVKDAFEAIQSIAEAPPGVDAGAFLAEIGERLFELLLCDYLAAALPATFSLLQALHVIRVEPVDGTATRPSFVRVRFDWAEIPKIVSEPLEIPKRVYGWGTADLDVDLIVHHLASLFVALRFPVRIAPPSEALVRGYLGLGDEVTPPSAPSLIVPFYYVQIAGVSLEAGLALRPLPASNGKLPGIVLEPQLPSEFPLKLQLRDDIALRIVAGTNIASKLGVLIRPDGIAVKYPFQPGTTPPSVGVGVGFDFTPAQPALILGARKETRLEFQGASVDFGASSINGEFDVLLGAQLKGLALVLTAGQGDSFIKKILGDGESRMEMALGFEWTRRHGVRFTGSGAFEVALHPHLQLGPVSIDEITIRLAIPADRPPDLRLELGAGISGKLGPLAFFVKGIGLRVDTRFTAGNVGPFDLAPGFKPPTGLGLSLDAGGVKGGGFLTLDSEKGEYAGGLELEFQGTISLKAVGLLNTKMPDGSTGFSLLIIITAEFPAIQLGFGFTLNGVGGLLGLNRTVVFEALRAGVHDGSLESVLFPHDIVANASRIIGDLKRIFPPLADRFVIGPMAKLGWGTPTLISLELGIILEIPRPAFAILGVLQMVLPDEKAPVLMLRVNFLGIVDFEKCQVTFDASLFDSHLLTFILTGDMAVRIYWGENANFLLTVGGFHPAYTPPPMGLPALQRLGIVIFQGNPNLRAESYFAITSNTVQFGAKVELYAGADVFNVYGFLGMDVLIQFNPFHFIAQVAAMLAVRTGSSTLFSVKLELMLEGPTPWHAAGKASFEIGFIITITISVHFDVTFGEERTTTLPPIEVLPLLREALENPGNWRAVLPAASPPGVSLRQLPPGAPATLVLHPFGTLEVTQKVVPLNLTISRFGTQRPEHGTLFRIASAEVGTASPPPDTVKEEFAPAQFLEMSDAEKLSRASFASYDAGIRVGGGDAPNADYATALEVAYEVIYLPEHQKPALFRLPVALFDVMVRGSAVARSPRAQAGRAPSPLATPPVVLETEKFGVASDQDLSLHDPALVFDSEAEAYEALRGLQANDPALARTLQVLPLYQVKAA
jgi:hypothetical protein